MTPLRCKLILVQVRTGGFRARVQTLQPARLAGDQAAGPGGLHPCAGLDERFRCGKETLFIPELSSHVPGLPQSTFFSTPFV